MMIVPFTKLPDDARLWIFAADRPLSDDSGERLLGAVNEFLREWSAHGAGLTAACEWRYSQFLLVAVDERSAGASGCSIDGLYRTLAGLERDLGVELTNAAPVWFRAAGGEVRRVTRGEFRALAEAHEVAADTVVFDNSVATVGDVRAERWETPASRTWHGEAFGLS